MGSETVKAPSYPHSTTLTGNEPDLTLAMAAKHPLRSEEAEVEWKNKDLRRDRKLSENREVSEKRIER